MQSYQHADPWRANVNFYCICCHLIKILSKQQNVKCVYWNAHSRCTASWPNPMAKVKNLTQELGLGFDLWPQGQCTLRYYHGLYVYQIWCW